MCQLTLVKTNIKEVMAPAIINILLENSDFKNRDGAGMFSPSAGIIKTEKQFSDVSWKNFFNRNTDNTVMAHVRAATLSGTGKKEISATNSHPYKANGIVLAHNGSLRPKNSYKPKAVSTLEETDSVAFLKEVVLYGKRNKESFKDSIKKIMEEYTGKFAFLAYDGENHYVIRGSTAPLHKCVISFDKKPVALIVNTEERDLKDALPLILHLITFYTEGETTYEVSEVPKETINIVNGFDLEQVDTIEENSSPIITTNALSPLYDYEEDYYSRPYGRAYSTPASLKMTLKKQLELAIKKLIELKVTPELLDKWSLATMGRPVLTLQEGELVTLIYFIERFQNMLQEEGGIANDFIKEKKVVLSLLKAVEPIAGNNTIHWPVELNSIVYLKKLIKNGGASVTDKQIVL